MKLYLISIAAIGLLLGGCSSTPKFEPVEASLECVVSKDTVTHNGEHSVTTEESCSNDPEKVAKMYGIDLKNCRRWEREDVVAGRIKQYGGYICRDAKGVWRPLSNF